MGSSSSKFRKHLQTGDEVAALNLYNSSGDLRKALDPSSSYGDSHQHDTPLHYAARHGMKSLLRIFLHDHGGNPNKTNGKKETALHCVCMEKNSEHYSVKKKRTECLTLILQWRGATLENGEIEKVDIAAKDEKENTALHYAAASGLRGCVELLTQFGCPLFTENVDEETPCDSAEKHGKADIALYLESKMVFSNESEGEVNEQLITEAYSEVLQDYSGLRAQDLQEAKDQLLVETADMLSVPLFTAEALLRNHEWSREMLLEAWMTDPFVCCEKCGVTPPPSLYTNNVEPTDSFTSDVTPTDAATGQDSTCDICTSFFASSDEPVHMSCDHLFCRSCWQTYLNLKIQEGDAHGIICPGYDCSRLVPVDVIESLVSRQMARKYLQFDIQAFVESNPAIKWCPYPGCGNAVRLPELEGPSSPRIMTSSIGIPLDTSRAVDCGNGHYFCWECLGEAHEPCSCANWKTWQDKILEIKPEQLSCTEVETETAANCLWLVTNSKACPNCKSPIQKNEGCNHMKCTKCKHDFCWVCLEPWNHHNSNTGGYFKCNRYEAVKKVEEDTANAVHNAEAVNSKMQELNRFVHYYSRFKNHEHSYKLEEPLLHTAKDKMMKLAEAVTDVATANEETKFVEEAVHQLLKARRVLRCSYVYGYYLDGPGYKKIVFEFMQTELEECTEILSQMVNRLYLRTPRRKIIDQATIVQRKRHEFISAIAKGLVPAETPPSVRKKKRRKYSMDMEDEELRKAILASVQEVDPANPWVKDASGRHTNMMAVLDWPGYDSDDSDSEASPNVTSIGTCARSSCDRPRAKNPRTGATHEHCSLRCLRLDQLDTLEQADVDKDPPEVVLDEQMDLLRALEMSRLQFMRDSGVLHTTEMTRSDVLEAGELSTPALRDPPKGKKTIELTPMEKLDLELQRVLEISSISPSSLDSDLKLAVEISLNDSKELPSSVKDRSATGDLNGSDNNSLLPLNDCLSPEESSDTPPIPREQVDVAEAGAVGGYPSITDTLSVQQKMVSEGPIGTSNTGFGIIKDLDVTNIHATDIDKTEDFLKKDVSLFLKQRDDNWSEAKFPSNCSSFFPQRKTAWKSVGQSSTQSELDPCESCPEQSVSNTANAFSELSFIDAESPSGGNSDSPEVTKWPTKSEQDDELSPWQLSDSDLPLDQDSLMKMTEDLVKMTDSLPLFGCTLAESEDSLPPDSDGDHGNSQSETPEHEEIV